jgi:hypothetical protein
MDVIPTERIISVFLLYRYININSFLSSGFLNSVYVNLADIHIMTINTIKKILTDYIKLSSFYFNKFPKPGSNQERAHDAQVDRIQKLPGQFLKRYEDRPEFVESHFYIR